MTLCRFCILKLLFFFSFLSSLLLSFNLSLIFLILRSCFLQCFLLTLDHRGGRVDALLSLVLLLGLVMRIVPASISVVGANLVLLSLAISLLTLLVEAEHDNLDVLLRHSIADQLNSELIIRPVLRLEAVEDSASVAIVFLHSLGEHAKQELLGQVLVILRVDLRLFLLALLLGLLLFLLLCESLLKLDILILKVLGGLIAHSVATLLPEVDKLVKSDQAALMLLSQEIGGSGSSRALRAEHNDIELLVLLESRRHLYLELIGQHLSELALKLTLKVGQSVASL